MAILERIDGPQDLKRLDHGELALLAAECRARIIDVITPRGGHLATNLGVVELTLALHRAFSSPKDKLVWDTSNQCYTHKLVTGRRDAFSSVRAAGGLSGFAEPLESPHDTLCAGHAGTGLSYAQGMALALRDDPGEPFVVAVVGDGALTCGLSYEGLNNISHGKPKRLIVVFNDNGWSISENVGWLVEWRNRFFLHPRYEDLRGRGHRLAGSPPKGEGVWNALRRLKKSFKSLFFPNIIWEELGLHYLGPIDGHDSAELERALERARELSAKEGPVVVHVLTQKGRGLKAAEEEPAKYHQPGTPAASGIAVRSTYSQVFAETLIALMERDPKIVGISAAMLEGTALSLVKKRFPDRVFDVGIAEAHAVTMAAGMAKAGWRPVLSLYSTFLQRAFDQILHDVCIQALPVTICVDRAGLVGDDGKTHQGIFDVAFTRLSPNAVVAAPKDENELAAMLYTAVYSGKPFILRYPRGAATGAPRARELQGLPIGKAESMREGVDLTFVAYGAMTPVALAAADALAQADVWAAVVNARFAKPLDVEAIRRAVQSTGRLLTLEEHAIAGGFGAAVLEAARAHGIGGDIRCHGVPDRFIEHASQAAQRRALGFDAAGVIDAVYGHFPTLGARANGTALAAAGSAKAPPETVTW